MGVSKMRGRDRDQDRDRDKVYLFFLKNAILG